MNTEFLFKALALIAVLTSLTVQALKKIFNEKQINYSSNLLAAIVAAFLSACVCVGYVLYTGIGFTIQTVLVICAMVYLSFLASTAGFDKIKQMYEQLKG